ncbi:MAG: hypothetical protein SPH68_06120, partial [Candidatus Borkfalkiaceae bacterium]|nr:hypothetical protein [Clostridia bacterium]MDY6223716.1 hypothetical protein [Christensenellaceae bacterium]
MKRNIIFAVASFVCGLCLFAACTDGKKIQSVIDAIVALPEVERVEIYDAEQINEALNMYNALSDAEKKKVSNYDKLSACGTALQSLERISECRNVISNLPSEATLLSSDRAAVEHARELFDALSAAEQLKITNYQVLVRLEQALNSSGWVESSKIFYINSDNLTDLSFLIRLKSGIGSFTCNGEEIPNNRYAYAEDSVTVNKSVLEAFEKESFNKFVISDAEGETFGFIVCKDIEKNQLVFFDFDTVSYTNGDPASVKNAVVENGIDGNSIRFRQNSTTNNLFIGFYKEGNFGFPQYEFVEGRTYELSFLMKDNGLDSAYCLNMPISFKSGFDIAYIRNNAEGLYIDLPKTTGLDNLIATFTKVEGTTSTYRFYSRFTVTDENVCSDLQISCWKKDGTPEDVVGSIDVLMDDILLMAKSPSYTVRAYLENLPDDVSVKDKQYVYSVYDKYEALTDEEKVEISVSAVTKLKKFRDYIFKEEVAAVQAKFDALISIPESEIDAALYEQCLAAMNGYSALRDFEKSAVKDYEKITAIKEKISAARIADVISSVSDLSETSADYENEEVLKKLNLAAKSYYALEVGEKSAITNAQK